MNINYPNKQMQGSEEKLVELQWENTRSGCKPSHLIPGKTAVLGVSLKTSLPWRNLQWHWECSRFQEDTQKKNEKLPGSHSQSTAQKGSSSCRLLLKMTLISSFKKTKNNHTDFSGFNRATSREPNFDKNDNKVLELPEEYFSAEAIKQKLTSWLPINDC